MTDEVNMQPSKLRAMARALPDILGVLGLGLLTRGLWSGWGEAVALSVCGFILLTLSIVSVARGER